MIKKQYQTAKEYFFAQQLNSIWNCKQAIQSTLPAITIEFPEELFYSLLIDAQKVDKEESSIDINRVSLPLFCILMEVDCNSTVRSSSDVEIG